MTRWTEAAGVEGSRVLDGPGAFPRVGHRQGAEPGGEERDDAGDRRGGADQIMGLFILAQQLEET